MDKYRRVKKEGAAAPTADTEVRCTAAGSVAAYVSYAAKLFNEQNKDELLITASGNAITKAVTLAEVVKRRFKGLHQTSSLGQVEVTNEYEPLEEGLEKVTDTKTFASIEIRLSKKEPSSKGVGYQAPIDESLVTEYDAEEMTRFRGRGRGRGRGRSGKGKGKGGRGGSPSKGKSKGKGKSKSPKGKGKGKSKDASPSKGKGKGKSKSKGKDSSPAKGKGKSKGKDKGKDKGKGKSKGYDEPWKGKGKSKGKSWDYDGGWSSYSRGWDYPQYGSWGKGWW